VQDRKPRIARTVSALLVVSALSALGASANPGRGPHERVRISATTTKPGASTGFKWVASYHGASEPHGDPPALRHLAIRLPRGTRYDTSVPGRCGASDQELLALGEAACPASSRIGRSEASLMVLGGGPMTYEGTDFNADHQLIELFEANGRPVGVIRTHARGRMLRGPVPTCLTGGDPPSGCPSDQMVLLSNTIDIGALTKGHANTRRNFATTPSRCPRSGHWRTHVRFDYADGSVDRILTRQPCEDAIGSR
jgi:hypothetical protein